jgi:predicted DNA-binding protein
MALLDELSSLSGQPKAGIVSEFVDTALPAMEVTLQALRVLSRQPEEARRLLSEFAHQQTANLAQAQLDLDVALDARTVKGQRRKKKGLTTGQP